MSTGLDRLGGLFASKRKASLAVTMPTPEPARPARSARPAAPEPLFPSPSFIRPKGKGTRMAARDEILLPSPGGGGTRRALSLPDRTLLPDRAASLSRLAPHRASTGSSPRYAMSTVSAPSRPTSLSSERRAAAVTPFDKFHFPMPPGANIDLSGTSLASPVFPGSPSARGHRQPVSPRRFAGMEPRSLTPPVDLDSNLEVKRSDFHSNTDGKTPAKMSSPPRPPTPGLSPGTSPGSSPELSPVTTRSSGSPILEEVEEEPPETEIFANFRNPFGPHAAASKAATSIESLAPPVAPHTAFHKEPDVDDFLNLSDDDIAETVSSMPPIPPRPLMPPGVANRTLVGSSRRTPSFLPVLPRGRPRARSLSAAASAALEAARIASRFDFDLVYVLNLWPEGKNVYANSRRTSAGSTVGVDDAHASMMGRLLAAYGLSTVQCPLNISAAVHGKILHSAGWIEYRSSGDEPMDFARGYACSFYAGKFVRSSAGASSCPALRQETDRGVVFAAYRKEGRNGRDPGCTGPELAELHRRAERLVEMLIDMHAAERMQGIDNLELTGPMPVRQHSIFA